MIDAKQAVLIAKDQAVTMLGLGQYSLEEIERESYKERDVWSITLSRLPDPLLASPIERLTAAQQYRRFLIDAKTGELVAMKLREFTSQ